ncbi:helix-turn-helix domain-containing protein [Kitasatospora sp. NPDC085895]|uniref:helix-turn-helix domain-containing protein n=1 Tax=Kitasatospora sp. NPDC085895 TaxID=3155057 RepID=UPI003450B4EB
MPRPTAPCTDGPAARRLAVGHVLAAFAPDLDAADGCTACGGWGLTAPADSTTLPGRCPDCQQEAEILPEVWWRRGEHLRGADRDRLAAEMRARYEQGSTIRALAHRYNRSTSFVHALLHEAGTTLRTRGRTPRP